jgi:hypothetical protein
MNSKLNLLVIAFLFLIASNANSQFVPMLYPNNANDCGTVGVSNAPLNPNDNFGGWHRPSRSDIGNAPDWGYFPVLVVFVQFAGEQDISGYGWHTTNDGQPDWMDSVISYNRISNSNWWDSYNAFQLSDYYQEFSRGKLHVIGQCESVVLPETEAWYTSHGGSAKVNKDVYDELISRAGAIDWPFYDRWSTTADGEFSWGRDGSVDMMYLIFRTEPLNVLGIGAEGFMPQGSATGEVNGHYKVYDDGNGTIVNISSGANSAGLNKSSGLVVSGRAGITTRELFLEVAVHEHGHYLFGTGHITYSKMAKGAGREFSLSPWETIKLGYIIPKQVNYSAVNVLGDISSRYGSAGQEGNIIEIPMDETRNDIFLIANRQKVSDWDRRMAGDTVPHEKGYLKNINPEYGKGIYIYHIQNGFYYPSWSDETRMDMECADGLWNWVQFGTASPDWSSTEVHPVFRRNTVSYNQDNPDPITSSQNRDGLSLSMVGSRPGGSVEMGTWYSIGKPHQYSPKVNGTDRFYTNEVGSWYSYEVSGDRWDAWRPGYNEVFSPYSSPNTNTWGNGNSGLFIYIPEMSGIDANIYIYKVGQGANSDLNSILAATPPSKPMGIKHEYYYPENSWCVPKITWNHNSEPDMQRRDYTKRYEVYRSTASDMNHVPSEDYTLLAIVDIPISETPQYIDYTVNEHECAELDQVPPYGIEYPIRYRVKAVDKTNWASVKSDFVSTTGITDDGGDPIGGGVDSPEFNKPNTPKEFNLSQNYPNPFNPVTKINFALPKQGFVTLKIYDITGREIQTLVSEFKQSGYYSVDFNGSSLSSGVYFYKIQSGDFVSVKRMVLIK